MRLPQEPDLPPKINILPMIDVIFAILVFFIVSSLYLTRSEGLPVNLPRATTTEVQKSEPITVSIDKEGKLTLDSQSTSLEKLKADLEQLIEPDSTSTVVINADRTVDHGQVVEVIDRLRQVSGVQLAIAAKQKQPAENNN